MSKVGLTLAICFSNKNPCNEKNILDPVINSRIVLV